MTEVEWNMVKVHMLELGISQEDILGLQKKLLLRQESDTSECTTVQEYLRDIDKHILALMKDKNINMSHEQYMRLALQDY